MNKASLTARVPYGTYSRARDEATQATKRSIVDAAQDLFGTHGFAGTGIAQIASRAGVSRQTFYLHFKSKIEVLESLIEKFEQQILGHYEELARMQEPSVSALAAWCERFLNFCEDEKRIVILLLSTVPVEAELAQDRAELYQRILTILGTGHRNFALAAEGNRKVRGHAVTLLAQIESLPRLAMTMVPLCERGALIEALAFNLHAFIFRNGEFGIE